MAKKQDYDEIIKLAGNKDRWSAKIRKTRDNLSTQGFATANDRLSEKRKLTDLYNSAKQSDGSAEDILSRYKRLQDYKDANSKRTNTQITIGDKQKTYTSAGELLADRAKARQAKKFGQLAASTPSRIEAGSRLEETRSALNDFLTNKKYIGSSVTAVREKGYADHLAKRKLDAAKKQQRVTDAQGGKGGSSGSSLVAYDAYGKPVQPVDPLKNFHGTMSNKDRADLQKQFLVQNAAYRTAMSQWNAENPNLVGRDVASLDRGTYAMSAENRAREAEATANRAILNGMTNDIKQQTKQIESANFLASNGYTYDDNDKKWKGPQHG